MAADWLPGGRILVADDDEAIRDLFRALLVRDGHSVETAADGEAALSAARRAPPDVVLSDVVMPRLGGFELCRRLKGERATRLIPVVLVTGLADRNDRLMGIEAGADDFLTKPVDAHQLRARVRSLLRLKRFIDELDSAESVILSLAVTVERRAGVPGHCERMAAYAVAFGSHLDLPQDEVASLLRAGYLHDIGKVAVPEAILGKPGPLSAAETALVRQHAAVGADLCGDLRLLHPVRPIVRHHHERWDGSGYPDGLVGDEIPLLAQVIGIVDAFEAMTTDRVYRRAVSDEVACEELRREAERGWRRPDLVEQFVTFARSGRLRNAATPHLPSAK